MSLAATSAAVRDLSLSRSPQQRPLRILYLYQYFTTPETYGGTRAYEMGRRLAAQGHDVQVVTSWPEEDGRRGWFQTWEAGMRVHWVPIPYSNLLSYQDRMRAFFTFAWQAARKAATMPADLIFATSTPLTIALPAVYAARRQGIPMVFEVRDLWPELPIAIGALRNPAAISAARWLERFAYRNAEAVVALSPGMHAGIAATGYPADRITVIPNSCDNGFFSKVSREEARAWLFARHPELQGGPLVGYTGTLGHINAVAYLVEMAALAQSQGSRLRFAVFGEGAEQDMIKALAQEKGVLGRNLWLYPPLPKRDMPYVLGALDLATSLFKNLPEMRHNSANKFFDALAAGRPVLINYGGWQAELLEESGAGLVAPPSKPHFALWQAEELLGAPGRLAAAEEAARTLARERFDRDLLAGQLSDLLCRVHGRSRRGAEALS
ncbi:glycosyltransferase family 4 protein [Aquibaculum sediminis]|uniref:glycosyltransferase family 4 protein n=1 Tax=Aquibaculum sediminis TaxID=3231907 RepID=UPI0034551F62